MHSDCRTASGIRRGAGRRSELVAGQRDAACSGAGDSRRYAENGGHAEIYRAASDRRTQGRNFQRRNTQGGNTQGCGAEPLCEGRAARRSALGRCAGKALVPENGINVRKHEAAPPAPLARSAHCSRAAPVRDLLVSLLRRSNLCRHAGQRREAHLRAGLDAPGIHVFRCYDIPKRGWPGQARPTIVVEAQRPRAPTFLTAKPSAPHC